MQLSQNGDRRVIPSPQRHGADLRSTEREIRVALKQAEAGAELPAVSSREQGCRLWLARWEAGVGSWGAQPVWGLEPR